MPVNEGKQLDSGHHLHPTEDELLRFMRGEIKRHEARAIVRHLLTGCQRCFAITLGGWERGERSPGLEAVVRETMAEVASRRGGADPKGGMTP